MATKKGNRLTPRTGYNPQTASRPAMRSRPNVLTDQARTSADAQRKVPQNPQIFQNPQGPVNVPTGRVRYSGLGVEYEKTRTGNAVPQSYGKKVGVAAAANTSADMMAALGYGANATTSSNPIISGRPLSGQSRRSGPSEQPVRTHTPPRSSGFASGRTPAAETGVPGTRGSRNYNSPNNSIIGGKMIASSPGHPVNQGMHAHGTPLTNKGSRRRP